MWKWSISRNADKFSIAWNENLKVHCTGIAWFRKHVETHRYTNSSITDSPITRTSVGDQLKGIIIVKLFFRREKSPSVGLQINVSFQIAASQPKLVKLFYCFSFFFTVLLSTIDVLLLCSLPTFFSLPSVAKYLISAVFFQGHLYYLERNKQ